MRGRNDYKRAFPPKEIASTELLIWKSAWQEEELRVRVNSLDSGNETGEEGCIMTLEE